MIQLISSFTSDSSDHVCCTCSHTRPSLSCTFHNTDHESSTKLQKLLTQTTQSHTFEVNLTVVVQHLRSSPAREKTVLQFHVSIYGRCSFRHKGFTTLLPFIKLYYPCPRSSVCCQDLICPNSKILSLFVSMVLAQLVNGISQRFFSTRWMDKHTTGMLKEVDTRVRYNIPLQYIILYSVTYSHMKL